MISQSKRMASKNQKFTKEIVDLARERMEKSHFPVLLGFHVESLGPGRAVLSMEVKKRHKQIQDVVHGGVLAALADTAAAIAAYTVVPHGTEIATIELKINYLSAVPGGKIKAEGKVLRAGRNFVVTECEVFDTKGNLAAKALLTFGAAAGHSMEQAAKPVRQ